MEDFEKSETIASPEQEVGPARTPEAILEIQGANETELVAEGLRARETLDALERAAPEHKAEFSQLRNQLDSLLSEAFEALRKFGAIAALGGVLSMPLSSEAVAPQPSQASAEQFADNPELATRVLEGVVEVGAGQHISEKITHEAAEILTEIKTKKGIAKKLAIAVAERIVIIALEVAGLSTLGHCLDLFKDVASAFKETRKLVQG